jgi:hypothetical protein
MSHERPQKSLDKPVFYGIIVSAYWPKIIEVEGERKYSANGNLPGCFLEKGFFWDLPLASDKLGPFTDVKGFFHEGRRASHGKGFIRPRRD